MNTGEIMVVDDSLASLKLLTKLLGAEGYRVRPADSGELALASIAIRPPQLILLDIRMPEMDGFEVLCRLKVREECRTIPVIFLSAAIEVEQRVEGFKLGAVDFVSKPFQSEELLARVSTHLELFKLRKKIESRADDLQQINERLLIAELEERKQAAITLARSHAYLQRFAEISAHHLQEPARRIATYAAHLTTLLTGQVNNAEAILALNVIGQQARRQQKMLHDIERYLSADKPQGDMGVIDVRALVSGVLAGMSEQISRVGAEITLGDLPAARSDVRRLESLFTEILENALKQKQDDRALIIEITGEHQGDWVRYAVSDNGPGVEQKYRERVFRVFERLTTTGEGTGIGLAIVRRVVESIGGRTWIEETPGGGCRVLFELPAGQTS